MTPSIRRIATLALVALAAAAVTVPSMSGAASKKRSASSKTTICKISGSKAQKLGATYVTYRSGRPGYRVLGTSCKNGERVIKAFHQCRKKRGRTGRCKSDVRGYRCSDRRPSKERLVVDGDLQEFTGHVTCKPKNGSRRIIHIYQQNV